MQKKHSSRYIMVPALTGKCFPGQGYGNTRFKFLRKTTQTFCFTLVMLLAALSLEAQNWTQRGQDILNVSQISNVYANSASLDKDGDVLVIGDATTGNGVVRVYEFVGNSWSQKGSDILGTTSNPAFGSAVAIADNGDRIVVGQRNFSSGVGGSLGALFVYDWNGSSWVQVGSAVTGDLPGDEFGRTGISISGDGTTIASGSNDNDANGSNSGIIKVFTLVAGNWVQMGSTINGANAGDRIGTSLSLDKNGDRLVYRSSSNEVSILEFTGTPSTGQWNLVGSALANPRWNNFGQSVDISGNGLRVAVGADVDRFNSGSVSVFEENSNSWSLVGDTIFGQVDDYSGKSVSLSEDGMKVAIGAPGSRGASFSGFEQGAFRVYEESGAIWSQVGSTVFGQNSNEQFGNTVSFSADGARVAAVSPGVSPNGQVEVYEYGTFAVLAPEIRLTGNGNEITAGSTGTDGDEDTDFGNADVVGGTITNTFTIENTGTALLNLTGTPVVALSGTHASDFSVTQPTSSTVSASGTVTFDITFDPSDVGTRTATVSIANDDSDENPYTFAIEGLGEAPDIALSGSSNAITNGATSTNTSNNTDFGAVTVGQTADQSFEIDNLGDIDLNLSGTPKIAISGPQSADFSWTSSTNIGPIQPSDPQNFTIRFSPSASGTRTATISIANDDPDEDPFTFAIEGTGVVALPEIRVSNEGTEIVNGDVTPSSSDNTAFGSVLIGNSTSSDFNIENLGTGTLNLTGTPVVDITGAHSGDFTVNSQPANSVSASGLENFSIDFTPSATGTRTATVSIANDDSDENPYTFTIEGVGTQPVVLAPEIRLTGNGNEITAGSTGTDGDEDTDFGNADVVGGTVTNTFTIENTGTALLNLTGTPVVALSGTHASDFSVTQPTSSTVSASGTVTFDITFDPSDVGTRTATVSIANDDSDENPYTFAIEGLGEAPDIALSGSSNAITNGATSTNTSNNTDFGAVTVGQTADQSFEIDNLGDIDLNLSGTPKIAISGPQSADFSWTSSTNIGPIQPSDPQNFTIRFSPSASGTRTATISIANDDPDEDPFTFAIEGTGVVPVPEIRISNDGIEISSGDLNPSSSDNTDFGDADVNTTVSNSYSIENIGAGTLNLTGTPVVLISGAHSADFAVNTQPANSVSSSNSVSFTIDFTPSATGARNATVSIANDDSDEDPYTFAIGGLGTQSLAPEIRITGNGIEIPDGVIAPQLSDHTSFGDLNFGATLTRTFTIENTGTADLILSGNVAVAGAGSGEIQVTQQPAISTITPGNSTTFEVTYTPDDWGSSQVGVSLNSNDADEANYNFTVRGNNITKQWVGGSLFWRGGSPGSGDQAMVSSSDPISINFQADKLTVRSGFEMNLAATATLSGDLINNGNGLSGTGTVTFDGTTSNLSGNPIAFKGEIQVVSGTTLNTNNGLTLSADASGQGIITGSGTVSGDVTVETYLALGSGTNTRKRTMMTATVAGAQVSDYAGNAPITRWDVREFNSSTGNFSWSSSTANAVTQGISHIFWVGVNPTLGSSHPTGSSIRTNSGTISQTGAVSSQSVSVPLNYSNGPRIIRGANFVGNPYPAFYDWDQQTLPTNVGPTIAYYAVNDPVQRIAQYTKNGAGVNGGSNLIAPGQGFIAYTTASPAGPLVFNPNNRVNPLTHSNPSKRALDGMQLQISAGETTLDEAYIGFSTQATHKLDAGLDAQKLYGLGLEGDEELNTFIAVQQANTELAICQLGVEGIENLPLVLEAPHQKELTISARTVDLQRYHQVWLEDKTTGAFTDLTQDDYTFSHNAYQANRFVIHFGRKAEGQNSNTPEWYVYQKSGQVYLNVPANQTGGFMQVLNTAGQVIDQLRVTDTHLQVLAKQASGVYLIRYNGKTHRVVK